MLQSRLLRPLDVQQNIRTISKQVEAIRITLAGADEESQSSEQSSGPNLPVTEIIEELDEDDNVICMSILPFHW